MPARRSQRLRREIHGRQADNHRDHSRRYADVWISVLPAAARVDSRPRAPVIRLGVHGHADGDGSPALLFPGDDVVILGSQGDDRIDVREMAATIGTIPWRSCAAWDREIERSIS